MAPLIDVNDVTKTYWLGEVTVNALAGVTVEIEKGSYVAIMGPSGSGKSTFMNLIGCLDRPTSGQYLLGGMAVESLDRDQLAEIRNQKIGFVFQNFNLLPRMNALENVKLPLLYKETDTPDADEQAQRALSLVGLAGRERNLPTQLSGGQQQRVAIARALITNPRVILADEPTGNLDSTASHGIMRLLRRSTEELGVTVLMVTHDPVCASYGDRVVRLVDGRVVEDIDVTDREENAVLARSAAAVVEFRRRDE